MMSGLFKRLGWFAYFLAGLLGVLFLATGFITVHHAVSVADSATAALQRLDRSELSRLPITSYESAGSHLEPNFYN
jgi:hypothetical protein